MYACWRGRSTRPTLEHREAVVGRFPRRRKVCESVGERRCDVAGSLVTFSSRLHRRLHTSWRGWWGLDRFSGIVKWCCDCAGCRAQSARVSGSDGATAQAVWTLCVSSHTDACSHLGAGGERGRFFHREMVLGLCRWPRTVCESVGERWRDGAGRAPTLCVSSLTDACMLTSRRGRWTRQIFPAS